MWLLIGFFSGIVFWHLVGFWSFVNTVVFKDERPAASEIAVADEDKKYPATVLGGIPPADAASTIGCTTLRLDRITSRTTTTHCSPLVEWPAMASSKDAPAETPGPNKIVPSVAGWAATVLDAPKSD